MRIPEENEDLQPNRALFVYGVSDFKLSFGLVSYPIGQSEHWDSRVWPVYPVSWNPESGTQWPHWLSFGSHAEYTGLETCNYLEEW